MANLATYAVNATTLAARIAQVANADFTGGMNRGSSNQGVGICTDNYNPIVADWTTLDQAEDARIPQESQHIGGNGLLGGDASTMPIKIINGADINDTAAFVVADTQATNGNEIDTVSGAINVGTGTVEIGDRVWAAIPVT